MEKLILKNGAEIVIEEGGSLDGIVVPTNMESIPVLLNGLTAENLSEVSFATASGEVTGKYFGMQLLNGAFSVLIGDVVRVVFGLEKRAEEAPHAEAVYKAIAYLSDEQALTVKELYAPWRSLIGQTVSEGTRFLFDGDLYKTIQPDLLIQEQYIPGQGTESLYVRLDESHAGTIGDPIPWTQNMQPQVGKYYAEGDLIAKCIEDPGQPLYHSLSALCPGRYFEAVSK